MSRGRRREKPWGSAYGGGFKPWSWEDVAAAACHSVTEQIFEQQLQEIEVRYPVIQVGGTSLISGMVRAMEDTLGQRPIVPPHSQYIGAAGAALLVSGMLEGH